MGLIYAKVKPFGIEPILFKLNLLQRPCISSPTSAAERKGHFTIATKPKRFCPDSFSGILSVDPGQVSGEEVCVFLSLIQSRLSQQKVHNRLEAKQRGLYRWRLYSDANKILLGLVGVPSSD